MNPKLGIDIVITLDGEEWASRSSSSFESAGEDLGKLERYYLTAQVEAENRAEQELEETSDDYGKQVDMEERKATHLENAYDASKEKAE